MKNMEVINLNKLSFLLASFFLLLSCNEKKNLKIDIINDAFKINNNISLKLVDSLKAEGYLFVKNIDFFTLTPLDSINPSNELNFCAFKKSNNLVNIINFQYGKISIKRNIKKYSSSFYKEERIIDSSDGGAMHYVNYYFSENKIIISVTTEDIFEQTQLNCYLDEILIIGKKSIIEYQYRFSNDLYLTKNFNLSNEQLLNIDNLALSLFYQKEKVDVYHHSINSLNKNHLWDLNSFN